MMTPLEYVALKRKVSDKKDARIIYLLYEGENTEPLFINPFIEKSNFFNNRSISFRKFNKTENDRGVTNLPQLIDLAKKFKNTSKNFRIGFDKIIIFFDLDVYKNNQEDINNTLKMRDDDIIFCYTNPSIELFLLLTFRETYDTLIEPDKKNILKNEFVGTRRYINKLFYDYTKINSKSKNGEVSLLSENLEIAILQEKLHLNRFLDKASSKLTCNIGYVFEKIKKEDFYINYLSK